jgi:hypothetical protein
MESVYHFVTIHVNETSWAHVWRLRSRYLRIGYDTFLSPQTSSRLSWVRLSSTHDFQLQIPKVDAFDLRKSIGVILRLSSYLGYDERLL